MMGISNWCGENFIGWWAADFQIYVLRFPSAKHSDEPLKAGIVLTFFLGRWCHNLIYPLSKNTAASDLISNATVFIFYYSQ